MNADDPCVAGAMPAWMSLCKVVMLPLAPPPGQPQQLHYMVVFHNMNHTNGGLAIKETFNRFAEQNFTRQPGCTVWRLIAPAIDGSAKAGGDCR